MSRKLERPRVNFLTAARREEALREARRVAFAADWLEGAPGLRASKAPLSASSLEGLALGFRVHRLISVDRARMVAASRAAPSSGPSVPGFDSPPGDDDAS